MFLTVARTMKVLGIEQSGLDFRRSLGLPRGKSAGSFHEQRLVIEPKSRAKKEKNLRER